MTVGLFGGSFNPPHLGHLVIAETIRETARLDQVLWVPARHPPHKDGADLADARHRLAMTRLATGSNPGFALSTVEIEREGPSYTVDTLAALQEDRPGDSFYLVLGADSLLGFHTWHRPTAILERVPLLVYPRSGVDFRDLGPALHRRARRIDAPLIEISSTRIRALHRAGRSIRYLVPENVRTYILENRLYERDDEPNFR